MRLNSLGTLLPFQGVVGGQGYAVCSSQNVMQISSRHTGRVQA